MNRVRRKDAVLIFTGPETVLPWPLNALILEYAGVLRFGRRSLLYTVYFIPRQPYVKNFLQS